MVVPIMIIRSIDTLGDVALRASEMFLNGVRLRQHGKKKIVLKPIIITEVDEDPVITLMTNEEHETLLARPEVRNGIERYEAVNTASQVVGKA